MDKFLTKKAGDFTVADLFNFAELYWVFKYPTLTLTEFCEITQKNKRKVYAELEAKVFPDKMIVDGYDYKKKRKAPLFHSKEVLQWIQPEKENQPFKSSAAIDGEIKEFINKL